MPRAAVAAGSDPMPKEATMIELPEPEGEKRNLPEEL
jgi:hypothetical protein